MIDRQFINNLSPVEVEFLSGYIYSLTASKIKDDIDNHENLDSKLSCCPKCKSIKYIKYGHNPKHRQKYKCKECNGIFVSTTNTIFSKSKINYNDWATFIASEINGLTLKQESIQISRSVTTCFNMRHKLYRAIEEIVESQILKEEVKFDCTYHKINLKGTKPENMPRISKKRGKSDKHNSIKGVSHHKICIFTAIDSKDNIITKIAGLGSEDYEKLVPFKRYFQKGSDIIADSKSSNTKFIKLIKCNYDLIPSKKHLSRKGNHISEINQIHSDLKQLNRAKKGISTRHLPDYLNWYCFLKKLIYHIEAKRRKVQTYMDIMPSRKALINQDICKIPMPINLFEAYKEYHYGIYANT